MEIKLLTKKFQPQWKDQLFEVKYQKKIVLTFFSNVRSGVLRIAHLALFWKILRKGGFRGRRPFLSKPIACRPKGSPFVLLWDIHFWLTDPKIFPKAPLAQYILILRGEGAPKKNSNFWSKFSRKCLKTLFWPVLSIIWLRRKKFWPKQGLFSALKRAWKSNLHNLRKNKRSIKFSKLFENTPRPTPR